MIMSYQESSFCTMYDRQDDYDLDEDNEEFLEEDRDAEEQDDSDEGICDKKNVILMLTQSDVKLLSLVFSFHF